MKVSLIGLRTTASLLDDFGRRLLLYFYATYKWVADSPIDKLSANTGICQICVNEHLVVAFFLMLFSLGGL